MRNHHLRAHLLLILPRPILSYGGSSANLSFSCRMSTKSASTDTRLINYNGRIFRSASNTPNGEVSAATTFHYHQDSSDIVYATYSGGSIVCGHLIATVQPDQSLVARYHHVNDKREIMTGKCKSTPEVLKDGRVKLHEQWEWTSGDCSRGESVVEEVEEDEKGV